MDEIKFNKFLKAAQIDERVCYDWELAKPYEDILSIIYSDVKKFSYYTLDGRFEDILTKLATNPKYQLENYEYFLKNIKSELEKLKTDNIMILPLNFVKDFDKDLILGENIRIFFPSKYDKQSLKLSENKILIKQQQIKRKIIPNYDDNFSKYFEKIIGARFDKAHILLAKDRNFFNYPILTIVINNIDFKVEMESGRIAEAVYTFSRMIDFKTKREIFYRGILDSDLLSPARTYGVYYNPYRKETLSDGFYGYSFRFNFSEYLDISTDYFKENIETFYDLIQTFIKSCFLDLAKYSAEDIKIINKWKCSISMFNSAYEFASIEKFDASVLFLCSILETMILKNKSKEKQKLLLPLIKEFFKNSKSIEDLEKIENTIKTIYKCRNDIMHEGLGYEYKFTSSRRFNDYQGFYRGMRPFEYGGTFNSYEDRMIIIHAFKIVIDVLISDSTLNKIKNIIN